MEEKYKDYLEANIKEFQSHRYGQNDRSVFWARAWNMLKIVGLR